MLRSGRVQPPIKPEASQSVTLTGATESHQFKPDVFILVSDWLVFVELIQTSSVSSPEPPADAQPDVGAHAVTRPARPPVTLLHTGSCVAAAILCDDVKLK